MRKFRGSFGYFRGKIALSPSVFFSLRTAHGVGMATTIIFAYIFKAYDVYNIVAINQATSCTYLTTILMWFFQAQYDMVPYY